MTKQITIGTINPLTCLFPHDKPYEQQMNAMHNIVDALENSQNVMFESPTGTGKSQTILSSVLSWCIKMNKKMVFITRTHDQIDQFVQNISKSEHRPKICILASKSKMCVHTDKNSFPNVEDSCRENIACNNCASYSKTKKLVPKGKTFDDVEIPINPSKQVFDLEDIVNQSKKKDLCPYFVTKTMVSKSNVICCPYNYIIDPNIFEQSNICLEDCVLVIDEAHNIESIAKTVIDFEEDLGVSFDRMIKELSLWCNNESIGVVTQFFVDFMIRLRTFVNALNIPNKMFRKNTDKSPDELYLEKNMLANLYTQVFKITEKDYINDFLTNVSLLSEFSMQNERSVYKETMKTNNFNQSSSRKTINYNTVRWLKSMKKTITFMTIDNYKFLDCFRCVVKNYSITNPKRYAKNVATSSKVNTGHRSLSIWNMNSALGMMHIKDVVRSMIFVSGTMHPFESLESELDVHFDVKLQMDHVIDMKKQIKILAVSSHNGQSMDSSMKNRENPKYFQSLFDLIYDICTNTPEGVLIFLPSFVFKDLCFKNWKSQISMKLKSVKKVFEEKQDCSHSNFVKMLKEYRQDCKIGNGACMFAIQRGKLSEGIDLSDECSRAVVAVGIPFPNMKETQIDLKMKYNTAKNQKNKNQMSGFDYIKKEAFVSLNQSIGRCIRHSKDYGMIYLVDNRFSYNVNKKDISPWLNKYVLFNQNTYTHSIKEHCQKFEMYQLDQGLVKIHEKRKEHNDYDENNNEEIFIQTSKRKKME